MLSTVDQPDIRNVLLCCLAPDQFGNPQKFKQITTTATNIIGNENGNDKLPWYLMKMVMKYASNLMIMVQCFNDNSPAG